MSVVALGRRVLHHIYLSLCPDAVHVTFRSALAGLALLAVAACTPDATRSSDPGRVSLNLSDLGVTPAMLSGQTGVSDGTLQVASGTVRIFFAGETQPLFERVLDLVALSQQGEGEVDVTFPLPPGREQGPFDAFLELRNGAGTALFTVGPIRFSFSSDGAPVVVTGSPTYVGPGADVASLRFDVGTLQLVGGDVETIRCIGNRGANGETEVFPRELTSLNPSVLTVDATGRVQSILPGSTVIRCRQLFGQQAVVDLPVTVLDRPLGVVVVSRPPQVGDINTVLGDVTVRVTGLLGANVGVPDQTVRFLVQTGGGFASPVDVVSNAEGLASTTWTLGSLIGSQTLLATVQGTAVTVTVAADGVAPVNGTISGVVRSATNGQPIGIPATVTVRSGTNVVSGASVASVTTGVNGVFSFPALPAGPYTVSVVAAGYVNGLVNVAVVAGASVNANVLLSPQAPPGQVRIVLSWGAEPRDLDAQLTLPNGRVIAYFDVGNCAVAPFACLDNDVTDGNGPETITITAVQDGVYTFAVDNFSARTLPANDNSLARSGAIVEVYRGNDRIATYAVPNIAGRVWTVFSLSGQTLTPINTITSPALDPAVSADRAASKSK
jgi:uncharacterized protein YfaP (DUF2135 family)